MLNNKIKGQKSSDAADGPQLNTCWRDDEVFIVCFRCEGEHERGGRPFLPMTLVAAKGV